MRIRAILPVSLLLIVGFSEAARAEPRAFHNFRAEVPVSWKVLSETVSEDRQSTLVKLASGDQKVSLSVNVENTVRPGASEVARLVEIYGGDKVFKPFKQCGDSGFRQKNPGGGWLALCSLGSNQMMSLILDGRETREVIRFVTSISELGAGRQAAPAPPVAEKEPKAKARADKRRSGR